jgi:nicotinamide riboside kinase
LKAEEKESEYTDNFLVCDTDLILIKIWNDYKYGSCSDWILEEISKSNYNLQLLTYIDIPWKEYTQREHPDKRDFLYMKYN